MILKCDPCDRAFNVYGFDVDTMQKIAPKCPGCGNQMKVPTRAENEADWRRIMSTEASHAH